MRHPQPNLSAPRAGGLAALVLMAGLLALAAMLAVAPTAARADDAAKKPRAEAQQEGHGHGHEGHDHSMAPAKREIKLTPEQLAELKRQRAQAEAAAEKHLKAMKLDPKLTGRKLGFMDGKHHFTLGMNLGQALKAVLAGGNLVRLKPAKGQPGGHVMEVITKDKKLLVFALKEAGDQIHITGLKFSRMAGGGAMDLNAARGAFYLISCMARL